MNQNDNLFIKQISAIRTGMTSRFWIHIIVILIFTGPVWAEDPVQNPLAHNEKQIPAKTESEGKTLTKLDFLHTEASRLLIDTAHWIDSYFEDGKAPPNDNESHGTLKFSFGYSRYDQLEVKPRLNVRTKLPRLSRRLNLMLEGSDNSDFNVDQNPISSHRTLDDNEKGQWQLALRYFLKENEYYKISLSAGLSWGYLYGGVKFRATQDVYGWLGRFNNRLRYYTDDGWENTFTYDLARELSELFYFRSTTGLNLYEHEEGIPHYQRFSLSQVLCPISAMTYEAGIYFDTKPSHQVTDIQFILKYRQRFLRDWLVLEVSPRISFPEEYHRKVNPGIVFTFLATFGYDAEKEGYENIFHR